ncbi:hypothetical protein C8R45DRAFT_932342 [Mycena sanguinolenta]|nr:hypothetical protein C8R45DRAFT_932342 [Mycena sanguinolenta]
MRKAYLDHASNEEQICKSDERSVRAESRREGEMDGPVSARRGQKLAESRACSPVWQALAALETKHHWIIVESAGIASPKSCMSRNVEKCQPNVDIFQKFAPFQNSQQMARKCEQFAKGVFPDALGGASRGLVGRIIRDVLGSYASRSHGESGEGARESGENPGLCMEWGAEARARYTPGWTSEIDRTLRGTESGAGGGAQMHKTVAAHSRGRDAPRARRGEILICGLGLACKPGLGLGLTGLWFHFPQAKAQASDGAWLGLAWA